jgi:hypothetical protein
VVESCDWAEENESFLESVALEAKVGVIGDCSNEAPEGDGHE